MEELGIDRRDQGGSTPATSNPQEARKLSIQRCIQSLVHACQCRDANCRLPSCHKMKRVVSHTKQCKRKTNGGCPICKQLIALCCYHAKLCQVKIFLIFLLRNVIPGVGWRGRTSNVIIQTVGLHLIGLDWLSSLVIGPFIK